MKFKLVVQLLKNMGVRYTMYRISHELRRRMGVLVKKFPTNPKQKYFISLNEWEKNTPLFLIDTKEALEIEKRKDDELSNDAHAILSGKIKFFDAQWIELGKKYNWTTHPITGHQYPLHHWSKIPDFNKKIGDIKYVWEKSRFTFLQTIIRYDYHFDKDNSEWVFSQIDSWVAENPVNKGPNWRCSQEMSLRLINWCYAFYFYKNSPYFTEKRWKNYQNVIYWTLHHVFHHIDFSRIAVRNNHAITETGMLFLSNLLFPFIPESKTWSQKGKKWLEEELLYQIYDDGTFLQFSMNYHRVVVQLITVFIQLGKLHNRQLAAGALDRAYKSLKFLYSCQDQSTGHLPNYGANDGALFFKWTNAEYRDYHPQLNTLHRLLTGYPLYPKAGTVFEDSLWFGINSHQNMGLNPLKIHDGVFSFPASGYYLIRDQGTVTFLRCGRYKDRPSQADNLHLDIWANGVNILRDAGSYKYNTQKELVRYFMGTASHNTVMVDDKDQMQKGSRFIWFYWSQAEDVDIKENDHYYQITGSVSAFRHIHKRMIHKRIVRKYKGEHRWEVTDQMINMPKGLTAKQIWHSPCFERLEITSLNSTNDYHKKDGWYSSYYGVKEKTIDLHISFAKKITTTIEYNP